MDTLSDAQLIARVLDGTEPSAFSRLVDRHHSAVYRYACHLVKDWMEAQDLTQEAFLKAHSQLHTISDPNRFGAWARSILFGLCMDWQRQFRPQFFRLLGEPVTEPVDPRAETPLDRMMRQEMMQEITDAAAQLDPRYRTPFTLYHLEALGYEAISEALDLPLNTVKSLLYRARRKLRGALDPYVSGRPTWSTIELDLGCLPSSQGWAYRSGYQFLSDVVPEKRAFSLKNGVLTLDNVALFPDNFAQYHLGGVVDPSQPFVLTMRARKLAESARFPEYRVDLHPRPFDGERNTGFSVQVMTGTELFELKLGLRQLRDQHGRVLTDAIDLRGFHDYRLEATPGVGCRFFVDDEQVGQGTAVRCTLTNGITLGDNTVGGGNARAEVTQLSFSQMRPSDGVTGTRRSEDLAESIFSERPFSRMGVQSPQCPQFRGWLADRYARDLVQTVGLSSHRWKIDPDRGVRPVDFAD